MENKSSGYIYLIAFALSIPAANYMIGNVGTFCVPDGPCLIPVAPGITAPSGVLMVGLALVLRDLVQRSLGFKWALGAVLAGAALSGLVATRNMIASALLSYSQNLLICLYTAAKKGLTLLLSRAV